MDKDFGITQVPSKLARQAVDLGYFLKLNISPRYPRAIATRHCYHRHLRKIHGKLPNICFSLLSPRIFSYLFATGHFDTRTSLTPLCTRGLLSHHSHLQPAAYKDRSRAPLASTPLFPIALFSVARPSESTCRPRLENNLRTDQRTTLNFPRYWTPATFPTPCKTTLTGTGQPTSSVTRRQQDTRPTHRSSHFNLTSCITNGGSLATALPTPLAPM